MTNVIYRSSTRLTRQGFSWMCCKVCGLLFVIRRASADIPPSLSTELQTRHDELIQTLNVSLTPAAHEALQRVAAIAVQRREEAEKEAAKPVS